MKLSFEIWPNNPYGVGAATGPTRNSWGDKPISSCIEKLAEYGYKGIDVPFPKLMEELDRGKEIIDDIRQSLQAHNIEMPSIAAHTNFINPRSWERKAGIDYIKKAIDVASKLDVKTVVTYTGPYYKPPVYILVPWKKGWEWLVQEVTECTKFAEERNVDVSIEVLPTHYVNDLDVLFMLLKEIDSEKLKVTVDTGHFTLAVKPYMSIPEAVNKLNGYINHVHLKDITGPKIFYKFPWFGGGEVNFEEFSKALREIGYDRYCTVEWEGWFIGGAEGSFIGDPSGAGEADMDKVAIEAKDFLERKGFGSE